jgi:hypothetical protein
MPHLFIIVPVESTVWQGFSLDPTALYMNSVKLLFICEDTFHTCGDGFIIKQPKVQNTLIDYCYNVQHCS